MGTGCRHLGGTVGLRCADYRVALGLERARGFGIGCVSAEQCGLAPAIVVIDVLMFAEAARRRQALDADIHLMHKAQSECSQTSEREGWSRDPARVGSLTPTFAFCDESQSMLTYAVHSAFTLISSKSGLTQLFIVLTPFLAFRTDSTKT